MNTHMIQSSLLIIFLSGQTDISMQVFNFCSSIPHGSEHGAIVVEDLDIATNFSDLGDKEMLLMEAEFKLSLNAYLSDLLHSPVRTLSDVIAFNNAHPVEVTN